MTQGDLTPSAQKWLTPSEAADYLRVTDRTIRNYAKAGRLTAYHIGPKLIRFDAHELEEFVKAGAR